MHEIIAAQLFSYLQKAVGQVASPVVVVPETLPSSCLVAFFHSAWDRVVVREVNNQGFCLIRTHRDWAKRLLGGQYLAWDKPGLRKLVRRLAAGSRCAAAMDDFVDEAQVPFAGT